MELLVGTRNRGKFGEIAEALVPLRLHLRGAFDFPEVPVAAGAHLCGEGSVGDALQIRRPHRTELRRLIYRRDAEDAELPGVGEAVDRAVDLAHGQL